MKPLTGAVLIGAASIFYLAACMARAGPGVLGERMGYFLSLVCGLLGLMFLGARQDEPKK
jgi:hypothetical protein